MAALAPGFRFHPTDEELISYYLKRKICNKPFRFDTISEIDIYKYEPSDLPGLSLLRSRDLEWYFFSALDRKYGNGSKTNRATNEGYWKTTGKDRSVRSIRRGDLVVGMKKTLVYHKGRAPRGERTNWVMHEYRIMDEALEKGGVVQDGLVLCRVFQKSGSGPKNGEQYGAPFVEEEWEDDGYLKVLVPNGEAEDNPRHVVNVQEYDQHQNDEELEMNHGLAIASENEFPSGADHMYNQNQYQESQGLNEADQKLFIGKGKAEVYSEEQHLLLH
ncbi:hypothetical protein Syun_000715 [Stephania yunnanensis]|uniref:NAC domain-containing protein n=1 Tax=Stephania yunnanensis TaxID=152371 RepID=A0AAP0LDI0_9MAGN